MTELTFTKSFLSTLDSRPLKLQPDYTIPPRDLEIHAAYTLPKMPRPMTKISSPASTTNKTDTSTPASTTITLKSAKNPPLDLQLKSVDTSAVTVLELKEKVIGELKSIGAAVELGKVKILWEKKPVSDAKTIKEVIGGEGGSKAEVVEFGVLVMGYKAPLASAAAAGAGDATAGKTAAAAVGLGDGQGKGQQQALDEPFWGDLQGFLQQRLKDEKRAEEVIGVFRGAWAGR